ncbi:MAG TPA: DUF1206 domain-containing protein [Pyrinomonadaceae bacterium]|jgi:hypothetical protein
MTKDRSVKEAKQEVEDAIDDAAASPWTERIARFGYATKGVVYMIVGGSATMAAAGWGGETTDLRGALQNIETQPLGKLALGAVAFGLVGYVIWRWLQAAADTEHKGTTLKGIGVRIGYFCSGAVYAGLAFTAAKILIDIDEPDSTSKTQQQWIARLMRLPYGSWVVYLAGAGVIGFGLYQIFKGYRAKFRERLKLGEMGESKDTWATWSGRIGYAARGVVFCIVGYFLIQAARHYNPQEAEGLDRVLDTLARQAFGPWILGTVAVGLIAYGFYMLVEARYRVIAGS